MKQNIPLCHSEFLQDFSIELGRSLKSIRHASKSVIAEVNTQDHDGQHLERLTVWVSTSCFTRATLALWEDKTIWVAIELLPTKNNRKFQLEFYPQSKNFTAAEIMEALRSTVSVSTRLCYNESPLPILRKIWKHTGNVETTGKLDATRKANSTTKQKPKSTTSNSVGDQQ